MTDIEIANSIESQDIYEIAEKLKIKKDYIETYGKYKAKISNKIFKELEKNKWKKVSCFIKLNAHSIYINSVSI